LNEEKFLVNRGSFIGTSHVFGMYFGMQVLDLTVFAMISETV